MSREKKVVIGFGNAQGQLSTLLIEEDYIVIERLNQKPKIAAPVVKAIPSASIDMDHFKNLLSSRRNQTLINNFLNRNEEDNLTLLFDNQE